MNSRRPHSFSETGEWSSFNYFHRLFGGLQLDVWLPSFVQQRTVVDSTGGPHTARVKNKTEYEVAKNDSNANESKKKGDWIDEKEEDCVQVASDLLPCLPYFGLGIKLEQRTNTKVAIARSLSCVARREYFFFSFIGSIEFISIT